MIRRIIFREDPLQGIKKLMGINTLDQKDGARLEG